MSSKPLIDETVKAPLPPVKLPSLKRVFHFLNPFRSAQDPKYVRLF